jgi:hypothetical protein
MNHISTTYKVLEDYYQRHPKIQTPTTRITPSTLNKEKYHILAPEKTMKITTKKTKLFKIFWFQLDMVSLCHECLWSYIELVCYQYSKVEWLAGDWSHGHIFSSFGQIFAF